MNTIIKGCLQWVVLGAVAAVLLVVGLALMVIVYPLLELIPFGRAIVVVMVISGAIAIFWASKEAGERTGDMLDKVFPEREDDSS